MKLFLSNHLRADITVTSGELYPVIRWEHTTCVEQSPTLKSSFVLQKLGGSCSKNVLHWVLFISLKGGNHWNWTEILKMENSKWKWPQNQCSNRRFQQWCILVEVEHTVFYACTETNIDFFRAIWPKMQLTQPKCQHFPYHGGFTSRNIMRIVVFWWDKRCTSSRRHRRCMHSPCD